MLPTFSNHLSHYFDKRPQKHAGNTTSCHLAYHELERFLALTIRVIIFYFPLTISAHLRRAFGVISKCLSVESYIQ